MDPDVLVLASDAGQELSQLELATIAAARHHNTQLIIAMTKIDLHAHWRRILEVNQEHLRRTGMSVPILPVSSRLYDLGRAGNDGSLSNESGIVPLLDFLDQAATGAREVYVCSRALAAVVDVTEDLTDELRSEQALLNDPEAAQRSNQQLLKARDRIERLRGGGAKWRERLYDGLERLQMETDHDLRARMTRLQTDALEEIEAIDPAAMWPVFSTRLERLVDDRGDRRLRGTGRQQQGTRQRRRPAVRRGRRLRRSARSRPATTATPRASSASRVSSPRCRPRAGARCSTPSAARRRACR